MEGLLSYQRGLEQTSLLLAGSVGQVTFYTAADVCTAACPVIILRSLQIILDGF